MTNLGKLALAAGCLAVIAAGTYFLAPLADSMFQPDKAGGESGIDVSNTPCEGIAAARSAVDAEYEARIAEAESNYRSALEAASDAYWENYNNYEAEKYSCESEALLADPCKEHFERASTLAKEILDNIDSGYDETKSAERDQAKADYEECMKNPPEEDTYEGKKAKCEADFAAAVALAENLREQEEANAQRALDAALEEAEEARTEKHATLDAIAEVCNIPPPESAVTAGGITTGGTGTVVESGNPACTGKFTGYDPETQKEIDRLRSLMQQARTGGRETGWGGAGGYSARITELEAQMRSGPRKCTSDSDCGDTTKVCCLDTQVGWVACSAGVCGVEQEDCEDEEICAGKPAECVAGSEGAESSGIEISRTFIKGGTCNPRLQVLNLQPKDKNSARFEIVGNVPAWLNFSKVGGGLPSDSEVSIDCAITKTEGSYTGEAKITIYDTNNNLINTIPVLVTIDVYPSIIEEDDTAVSAGGDMDLTEPEDEEAVSAGGEAGIEPEEEEPEPVAEEPAETVQAVGFPGGFITLDQLKEYSPEECDCCDEAHWHARAGFGITSDGETINDPYSNCGLGKVSANPIVEIEKK